MPKTAAPTWGESRRIVPGWPYDRPAYTSLDAAAQGETARINVPGIAVGVLHKGEITTTSAGFGNLFTKMPLVDDAILQIGSISKVWSATLAMMLVDDGVLDLDTPVIEYLPDLRLGDPEVQATVTMRHLLSHTSGIEGDRFLDYGRGDDALAVAISHHDSLRQWFRPGDLWSYSNAGYYLACRVIEVVTGKVFETVFRERLIELLELPATFFFADEVIAHPHAIGHVWEDREQGYKPASNYELPRYVSGTGSVVTSTRQLLRFAQLHLGEGKIDGKRLLKAKSTKAMQAPIAEAGDFFRNYGIGWCIHEYPDFRTISHGGATNGFRANLTVFPDHDFAIATLTNGNPGGTAVQEIEAWALRHYLDLERPTPAITELAPEKLAALAGTYVRHDGRHTIRVEGNHLVLESMAISEETGEQLGETSYQFAPAGERRFIIPDGAGKNSALDFIAYEGNGAKQDFIRFGGRLAERTDEQPAKAKGGKKKTSAKKSKS